MDYFNYKDNELYAEDVKVSSLVKEYGTPLYVYSKATLQRHMRSFEEACSSHKHLICYAVKANSSLSILSLMAKMGAGFDIVSKGELLRVLEAGGDPKKVVFSGVGKTDDEIAFALKTGINCLNVESEAEAYNIENIARDLGIKAKIAIRVNPNVDAKTHPSISTGLKNNKFGISYDKAFDVYKKLSQSPYIQISGIDCHIGSQMTSGQPIVDAVARLLELYHKLKDNGINIDHIDIGGGLGVTYGDETPPSPSEFMSAVIALLKDIDVAIYIEPGRAMVANAGILLTQVLYTKQNGDKNFCIVDAGMNDLIRPALYNSWMNIIEANKKIGPKLCYDVVGPVCESDDFLGKDRHLCVERGDILAVRGAGAYGSAMSSTYNSRALCAEVMVSGDKSCVIRKRQDLKEIFANEVIVDL